MATEKELKKVVNKATQAVKTNVSGDYKAGAHEALNAGVSKAADATISSATNAANAAHKTAVANNQAAANQTSASNNMVTKQISNAMDKQGYSMTSKNIASAASARNAAGSNAALEKANQSAAGTRNKTITTAKVAAYKTKTAQTAANSKADVARATSQVITESRRKMQEKEAKRGRKLSNALAKLNIKQTNRNQKRADKLEKKQNKRADKWARKVEKRSDRLEKRKERYDQEMKRLTVYGNTVEARYSTVKAVDKAIKKMTASKTERKLSKLSYLRALRAKLLDAEKKEAAAKKSGGGGGRRGGGRRSYGRRGGYRRYGSSGSTGAENLTIGKTNSKSGKSAERKRLEKALAKQTVDILDARNSYKNFAHDIAKVKPKRDKAAAKRFKTSKGWYTGTGKLIGKRGK